MILLTRHVSDGNSNADSDYVFRFNLCMVTIQASVNN